MMITVKSDLTQIFVTPSAQRFALHLLLLKVNIYAILKQIMLQAQRRRRQFVSVVHFGKLTPVNKPLGGIFIQYIKNFTSFFYFSPRHFLTNQNPYYYCIDHLEAYN